MFIARTVCATCGERVWRAAKSHTHYTHIRSSDCPLVKVQPDQIRMERVA